MIFEYKTKNFNILFLPPPMQYNIYYAQEDYITGCLIDIHATGILWDERKERR